MQDSGYGYLKSSQSFYDPKTPRAALKAIETGLLPNEAFIYRANPVHPLFEEPVDITAIERTLSNKNNDLSTNLLLVRILEQLLKNPDSETALFAAESINAIENIYNERIEGFKKSYAEGHEPGNLRSIAKQFYEIGLLNGSRRAIKNFYLYESYSYIKRYGTEVGLDEGDFKFVIRIMISLNSLKLARGLIVKALERYPDDVEMVILAAEIEFHRRNFRQVKHLFRRIANAWEKLPPHLQAAFEHWVTEE